MTEHTPPTPRREQLTLSRDAVAVVEATWAGDEDRAAELVSLLLSEPERVPFVVGAFVALVGTALRTDSRVSPELWVEACRATIDHAEAGDDRG